MSESQAVEWPAVKPPWSWSLWSTAQRASAPTTSTWSKTSWTPWSTGASVSRDTTRVGVVLYSHVTTVVVGLEQAATPDQVKSAVRSMTYMGEGTFTGSAIQQANQVFRGARPGVRKVAIVITDGQADKRDSVQLERAVAESRGE